MQSRMIKTGTRSLFQARALVCAVLSVFPILLSIHASAQEATRLPERIDESVLVSLKGNTHPMARASFDRGVVEPDFPLERMELVLTRSAAKEAALQTLLAGQYDPSSPSYHQWLSPTQFGQKFGPSLSDIARIKSWLEEYGLVVNSVSKGRVTVEFSGTASQVEAAFHTEIHRYLVNGVMHTANASDPRIPAGFSPLIAGVLSLHDFTTRGMHHVSGYAKLSQAGGKWQRTDATGKNVAAPLYKTTVNGGDFEAVSPYDFATIYNVLPLWNASTSLDGKGVAIAIVGRTDIKLSDVATFRSTFGLPANVPNVIVNGADPGTNEEDQVENTLDVEWSGAVARSATIDFVTSKSTSTTDGVDLSEQYIIDNKTAPILSASFGACELNFGTTHNKAINSLWQQGAAEGISIFVASDDQGAAGCDGGGTAPDDATNGLQVNGLASTVYNVAVGGTDFNWMNEESTYWNTSNNATTKASAKSYIPETTWNDTCTNPLWDTEQGVGGAEVTCNDALQSGEPYSNFVQVVGGGGGVSSCTAPTGTTPDTCAGGYAKPSWQAGTGVPNDGKRDLPDISLFAATGEVSNSSYLICVTAASPDGTCNYTDSNDLVALLSGGTSVSTPAMAGVMAIVVQSQGAAQGNPNPVFYALAKKQSTSACNSTSVASGNSCTFYDQTVGTNAMPCNPGSQQCVTSTSGDEIGVQSGFSNTTGYDMGTGLGSINVSNLVKNWSSAAAAPAVSLSPASLTFASTTVGVASAAQTVTLKNTGSATLSITSITLTGTNSADYSKTTTCGSTLAAAATCTVSVTFKPTATGTRTAALSFADNAAGSAQTLAITGTATAAAPVVSLSPSSLKFASTTVGVASAAQTVTLKNTGSAVLNITSVTLTGTNAADYSKTTTCGTTLAAAASCTVSVTFKPSAAGTRTAALSFADNAAGSAQTIAITGTGAAAAAPIVSLSPTSLTFASTIIGVASSAQTVTLKNTGSAVLNITSVTLTGTNAADYSKTTTCGSTLAAAASCTVSVTFKPTAAGTRTAALSFADNAAGSAQTVALSGTGASTVTFSPTSLSFASTDVGSTSALQTVTLTNTASTALTISSISIGGTNATSFIELNECPSSLASKATCQIEVAFRPTAAGGLSATLSVADNAVGSPQTIALQGTGAAQPTVSLTPTTLSFAATAVGKTTEAQSVVIKNTGTVSLALDSISLGGANATSFQQVNTCSSTLAAGASCTVYVAFGPLSKAALTASLVVSDNAKGGSQSATLTGTGQ